MDLAVAARRVAERLLAERLPRRWRHVQAVAGRAGSAVALVPVEDRDLMVASAWLHDVGYSPGLSMTGFHPLDGGRWLRDTGHDQRLASLVAHHSCAAVEAGERGLADTLEMEFSRESSMVADVLWWADMTTGPDGERVSLDERLAEISSRYGPGHVVARTWQKAGPMIAVVVDRVEKCLAAVV